MPKFRSAFDPGRKIRQHVGEGTQVQQHFRDETDINRIMSKYQKTGVITHLARYAGQYGDFSDIPDYQSGLNRIRESQEMFMTLPSDIRAKFKNDPGEFIAFASDPENLKEMQDMGLAPKSPPEAERPPLVAEGGDKPPKAAPPPASSEA